MWCDVFVLTHNHLCYQGEFIGASSFYTVAFHSEFAWTVIAFQPVLADPITRTRVQLRIQFSELTLVDVLASIGDVRVAIVVFQAPADIAMGSTTSRVGTIAVAADAGVVRRWFLAFPRACTVPDGEVEHEGDAPRVPPGQHLDAVQVRRVEKRYQSLSTTMA